MRKSYFVKLVALMVCLAFIGITSSGLFAAERKAAKFDFRLLFENPVHFFMSIFPGIDSLISFKRGKTVISTDATSTSKVKPTGELTTGRPSIED